MDRAPACGAGDTSSIPVRRSFRRKAVLRRGWPFSYTFSTMFQDYKRQQRH